MLWFLDLFSSLVPSIRSLHAWYRATVEHTFAQMKRFAVLGCRYRGQLESSIPQLNSMVRIILTVLALDIEDQPLKAPDRIFLLDSAELKQLEAEVEREEKSAVVRKYHAGLP